MLYQGTSIDVPPCNVVQHWVVDTPKLAVEAYLELWFVVGAVAHFSHLEYHYPIVPQRVRAFQVAHRYEDQPVVDRHQVLIANHQITQSSKFVRGQHVSVQSPIRPANSTHVHARIFSACSARHDLWARDRLL